MPAGMHFLVDGGAIVDLAQFVDGQCVHIGADGDSFRTFPAGTPAQQANDACFCDTGLHLQPQAVQRGQTRGYVTENRCSGLGKSKPSTTMYAPRWAGERVGSDPKAGCGWRLPSGTSGSGVAIGAKDLNG